MTMGNGASASKASPKHTPTPHLTHTQSNLGGVTPKESQKIPPTQSSTVIPEQSEPNGMPQKTSSKATKAGPTPVPPKSTTPKPPTARPKSSSTTQKTVDDKSKPKKNEFQESDSKLDSKKKDEVQSVDKKKATQPASGSADKNSAHNSKQTKHKLYFPTVDDLVFETFYHNDGRECECMYMNGQRFYLDSWNSKEWQVFPMKWYDEGLLVTNSIINDKEGEAAVAVDQADQNKQKVKHERKTSSGEDDDREGWIQHPKRGQLPTYIFEERHNVHCFFDVYSGMWLRLPLGWELIHDTVKKMVETVEASVPGWKDRYEILAMLRACNYNPDECISNYLQIAGDELKGMRSAGDAKAVHAKDEQITELKAKLATMEKQLKDKTKAKIEADALVEKLQSGLTTAQSEQKSLQIQVDSLTHARPKTARPKTPQVQVVSKISDDDLDDLQKKSKRVSKSYLELQMDVKRMIDEMKRTMKEACTMAIKLKAADGNQIKQLDEVRGLYRREAMQRKILYNQLQELRGNIRVFLRCRKDKNIECCMKFPTDQDVEIPGTAGGKKKFQFDKVYTPASTQDQLFEDTLPIIACSVDGYNVCIMAYGQTGSGKTYTMMGPSNNPGVNIRSIQELLKICKERSDTVSYVIKISIIEIYNETIQDLLTKDAGSLELRVHGNNINIEGLAEMEVQTLDDIKKVMALGEENRSVASTKMNSSSSRSHLVMMVHIVGTDRVTGAQSNGKLMLCDLAGSERIAKSEATGQRLTEAAAINKSLSALGQVFSALRSKQLHIPYRNSKLTHILQPSLGGDAKTCLFVNVSPDIGNQSETLSTLQFGSNARQIQLGQAKQNIVKGPGS